jgi:hypothetical protein
MQFSKALNSSGGAIYKTADDFRLLIKVRTNLRGERACYIVLDNISPLHTAQLLALLGLDNPENWQELTQETAQSFFQRQDGNDPPMQEGGEG